MSAPVGGIHPLALVGEPPQHRKHRHLSGFHAPVIAESALIEAYATVDAGVKQPTRVGARSWVMKHSHVGMDTVIGADVEISSGVVIGGNCRVGDGARVGMGSCVRPWTTIGPGAVIGAGAVVVRNVPAGETWVGCPARPIEDRDADDMELWRQWWDGR